MTVAGQTQYTQPFTVVKDMMIPSSDADLVESTKAQIRVRDAMNQTVDMANRIEIMRRQIEDQLKANRGKDELEKPLMDLDKQIRDVELIMLSDHDMYSDDKQYVEHYHLYQALIWLNGVIGVRRRRRRGRSGIQAHRVVDGVACGSRKAARGGEGRHRQVDDDGCACIQQGDAGQAAADHGQDHQVRAFRRFPSRARVDSREFTRAFAFCDPGLRPNHEDQEGQEGWQRSQPSVFDVVDLRASSCASC